MVQPSAMEYDFAARERSSIYEPYSDGRRRRDSKTAINTQPPRYDAHSPSRVMSYSPTNGNHPPSPYQQYSSRPSTSSAMPGPPTRSPHHAHLPSPKMNGAINHGAIYDQRDTGGSFYDAVSDSREGQASWNPHYHVSSPSHVRAAYAYPFFGSHADNKIEPRSRLFCWILSRCSHLAQHLPLSHEYSLSSTFSNRANITCASAKPPQLHFAVTSADHGRPFCAPTRLQLLHRSEWYPSPPDYGAFAL